jgi:competence CoiA-like predicted nuclease
MGRYDRLIRLAFDKISKSNVDANELFDTKKDAFEIRKQSSRDEFDFFCKECDQPLEISTSKYDRLHFKHVKGAEYCILKDEDLSPEEREKFTLNLKFKESDRHKFLKNRVAELLQKTVGVETSSIYVDDKFIIKGNEKRRPDVHCVFENKEIFEIQLSNLSLRYILSRYDFYQKNGIYLIWILDDFDIHGQAQMERDIKYLNKYQNFFKLDESHREFKLTCDYKYAFLNQDNIVLTPWTKNCR